MPVNSENKEFIIPDWSAPTRVCACTTTRQLNTAVTNDSYAGFNLADHVGDEPDQVQANRQRLQQLLALPSAPVWLQQVHGNTVLDLDKHSIQATPALADAAYARALPESSNSSGQPSRVCAVLTADCLPLLLCDQDAKIVAAIHAGWRGLLANIIAKTVSAMAVAPSKLLAWLGPAISAQAYEVNDTVYRQFINAQPNYATAFNASKPGHWWLDLYAIARQQLQNAGVSTISGGNYCTYRDQQRFYSYRRQQETGRMASLIWLQ